MLLRGALRLARPLRAAAASCSSGSGSGSGISIARRRALAIATASQRHGGQLALFSTSRAAAAAASQSHRADSSSSSSSWAVGAAGTAALLAAMNAWAEDYSKQDAGTFHARPPSRPHRVVYSIATYPGNEYIEDRHEIRELQGGDVFCGIFDGHGGWQVAEYASTHLSKNLETELANMGALSGTDQVSKALVRAFERTDRGVIHKVHHAFEIGLGNVAKVGCCALTMLVKDHHLYVANAGDCRAVLGKRLAATVSGAGNAKRATSLLGKEGEAGSGGSCKYAAVPLSADHNAKLPGEMAKLREAHPGEEDIVKCKHANACYVKGRLQPTRALGDAYLKFSEFNGRGKSSDPSAGRYIPPPYTPPYITATPEVQVYDVLDDPSAEFVILATDGVWDLLSNEEAVRFVGQAIADGETMHVSQRLIAHALETRAKDLGMTVEELRSLPPGKPRRSKHDDMTCLVILLQGPLINAKESDSAAATNPQDGIDVSIDPTVPPPR